MTDSIDEINNAIEGVMNNYDEVREVNLVLGFSSDRLGNQMYDHEFEINGVKFTVTIEKQRSVASTTGKGAFPNE